MRRPAAASPMARLTARLVLPTPPLPLTTASTRARGRRSLRTRRMPGPGRSAEACGLGGAFRGRPAGAAVGNTGVSARADTPVWRDRGKADGAPVGQSAKSRTVAGSAVPAIPIAQGRAGGRWKGRGAANTEGWKPAALPGLFDVRLIAVGHFPFGSSRACWRSIVRRSPGPLHPHTFAAGRDGRSHPELGRSSRSLCIGGVASAKSRSAAVRSSASSIRRMS